MRLWEDLPVRTSQPSTAREDETIGYVIKGREKIQLDGHTILLDGRDSWIVSKGASHSYTVLETLTAIEATYPPAHMAWS